MNDKQKQAMALGYKQDQDNAPKVLAKGKGYVAANLIENAVKNDVPIQEDASLVELLSQLNINEEIPEELYQVVAEVFSFIYRADQEI
ncbi:hypothetical protein GCM10007216_21610 [Thalassobacillus devorans]|uniref:Flagellar biosynthesis protein n=1 Tax=Thalassobacillus devorans TaxID=279813 RepID=A0ABQ1P3M7_9BACI|nr:EscU/YscU/HrcU family type III secretion system export apparatus switch protein [Thalassobacillus devorans]NIK27897.1 flagellar biosynthesis protein [Thalassobacillus devorans]GGC90510.1 hypothetical protein GCM10007216_21610 [Thalassobacillus devorans]